MKNSTKNNSELIEITFILPWSGNSPGDICQMETKYALKLIQLLYARPTTEEDKVIPPPVEYIEVIWIRPHVRFANSAGDIGLIESKYVEDLVNLGHVELIERENKI